MDNRNMGYRARIRVSEVAAEPAVAWFLNELATRRRAAFVQGMNTAYLAAQLLEVYHYDGDEKALIRGMLLHDVGELMTPNEILGKPGRLSPEERRAVQKHVQEGAELLTRRGITGDALTVVLQHHERSDGTGYPAGVESPDIARCAKIAMVCDVYEALTTDRPQRKAFNMYEAVSMMTGMPLSHGILQSIKNCDDT